MLTATATLLIPIHITVALGASAPAVAPASAGTAGAPAGGDVVRREAPGIAEGDLPMRLLAPIDVLLYRGRSFLSRAIQLFDGTDVSHAALYLGGGAVGEALGNGVIRNDVDTSFGDAEWVVARRLKATPLPDSAPVLDRADTYLMSAIPYAYHQLILLAFLSISRKVKVTPIFDLLVRKVLDGAAALLNDLGGGGKRVMICSEFVFRCYDEATPRPPYDLHLGEPLPHPRGGAPEAVFERHLPGRGVDPESLLARVSRSAVDSSAVTRPPAPVDATREGRQMAPDLATTLLEIEELSRRYLAEVRETRTTEARVSVDIETIQGAVERFAVALQVARAGTATGGREGTADSLRGVFDHLYRTAADFVTPGDLYKAESLFTVGRVSPG